MFQSKVRLVAVIMSVILIVSSCPISAYATDNKYEGFRYSYNFSGGISITGYEGVETNITIPSQIEGANVTEISPYAFEQSSLRSVVLPQYLQKIGQYAFSNSQALATVIFNQKLEIIENHAFNCCGSLVSAPVTPNLQIIGSSAFFMCTKLSSFYGFDELAYIGDFAFYGCTGIKSVTIPKSVTEISRFAFSDCTQIEEITFYETLETINSKAFYGVRENIKINFLGEERYWYTIDFTSGNQNLKTTQNITFSEPCEHLYLVGYVLNPTCKRAGEKNMQCIFCENNVTELIPATNIHDYEFVYDTPISCDEESLGHYECSLCGEIGEQDTVAAEGHTFDTLLEYVPSTYTKKGKWVYQCFWCDETATAYIDKLKRTKLTKAKITVSNKVYTGKELKPTVTVKLNGKKLKKGTHYTVSYKNNKKIGTATVTIKGKNKYIGTKTATFKITPKKNKISYLKSNATKKLKVKWSKVSTASGYQIVVATNKKFTKNKKVVYAKKKSKVSLTVSSLKSGKTYYVRVRAYKEVKGKKIYAPYSSIKKIKVK